LYCSGQPATLQQVELADEIAGQDRGHVTQDLSADWRVVEDRRGRSREHQNGIHTVAGIVARVEPFAVVPPREFQHTFTPVDRQLPPGQEPS
jgi:hypothetical protein